MELSLPRNWKDNSASHHSSLLGGFKGHQSGHCCICALGATCCLQAGNLFFSLVKFNLCLGLLLPVLLNLTAPTGAWWGWSHEFSLVPFGHCGSTCRFLKTLQHFCDIVQFIGSRSIFGLMMSVNYKISYIAMCNRYRVLLKKNQDSEILQIKNTLPFFCRFSFKSVGVFFPPKYFDLNETTIFHKENISSLSDPDVS